MSRVRTLLKERFPRVRRLYALMRTLPLRLAGPKNVFTKIYRRNLWEDPESLSGPGSNLAQTEVVRQALPELLRRHGCRTMLDAPCGDFHWMKEVPLDLDLYIGADIVEELVASNRKLYGTERILFRRLNIITDPAPKVDLILCRDGLVHLSFRDALAALRNFARSGSSFLLTTTHTDRARNEDIVTGQWRPINPMLPPFGFPEPLELINERYTLGEGLYRDKSLGLWRISDLTGLSDGTEAPAGR
jgi:hypothetical protein